MSILHITHENFEKEVLESGQTVLIDFWAPWCGPCRMLTPVIDQIADELSDTVKVGKVNIDNQPELAEMFHVMSIPTLVVIKDKKVITTKVGVQSQNSIKKMIETADEEYLHSAGL